MIIALQIYQIFFKLLQKRAIIFVSFLFFVPLQQIIRHSESKHE